MPAASPPHHPLALGATAVRRAQETPPVAASESLAQAPTAIVDGGTQEPVLADGGTFLAARPAATIDVDLSANRPIRIVLVEDVAEVATHVRDVLRPQGRFKLVHTIREGHRAVDDIRDLDPDVVLVDSLLQGKTSARQIVDRLRGNGRPIGIVVLTVPDYPAEASMLEQADAVVSLPFGTFDLGRAVMAAHAALTARDPGSTSRVVSVFSAKGGVGRTTIAYNLAATLATTGLRTVLLDGSLQFGDVRRLLRVEPTQPSICDLPTDSIRGSDLAETVLQVAPGLDALLAPPRPELAELINGRDLGRVLDILRRAYQAIVIDTPANLAEPTLALLDASDVIIDVLTAEPGALEATRMIAATFPEIGYPSDKIRYLVNRADSVGAAPMTEVARAIGRMPEYMLASDWPLVSSSNRDGIPYVLAQPEAPVSVGLRRVAHDVRGLAVEPPVPLEARPRSRIA
jgi:pilus assembly protein CpaE